jgi:ABC-type phosphate transport system substrate-binding protein
MNQMKRYTNTVLYVVATTFCLAAWPVPAGAQVAIVANKSVPVDTIMKSELRDFYSKEIKEWSDGRPVILLDLKSKSVTKDAFYAFLGKSASRMKSVWLKKMLLGEGEPPESVDTEEKMLEKIASTAGAIGYISVAKISKDVKILIEIDTREEQ